MPKNRHSLRGHPSCQNQSKLTRLAVQSLSELVDCRRNLQTLVEDGALPLQADITRPFHKACQITLGLNILAYEERQKHSVSDTQVGNLLL